MACDAGVGLCRDCSNLRKFPLVSLGGVKLSSTEGTREGALCGEGLSATTRTSAEDAAWMATLQAMGTLGRARRPRVVRGMPRTPLQ